MKQYTKVDDIQGEGLEALAGTPVMLFCMNYIYSGTLTGINDTFVKLTDAKIVFETGSFTDKGYKDAQSLPGTGVWYIQRGAIESFGVGK